MEGEHPKTEYWGDEGGHTGHWPDTSDAYLLAEVRFWTRIMREHAMFIRLGLPCDRPDLIGEARALEERLEQLEAVVNRATTLDPTLLRALQEAVAALIDFKRRLLRMVLECQIRPNLFPLLIDHITREAVHFLTRLEMAMTSAPEAIRPLRTALQRAVFWMRIMKEHVEFIIHLLDPSERALIAQSQEFKRVFEGLFQTAMDLESMAEAQPRSFNRAARFIDEAIARTTELRDFKAAGHELLLLCQLLSAVPTPILVDHLRREADRAIVELRELRECIRVERPPVS